MGPRIASVGLVLVSLLAACKGDFKRQSPLQPSIDRNPFLRQTASCGELETAIEDTMVAAMKASVEGERRSASLPPPPLAAPTAPGASGPMSYTTTNSQVAGVDEADFVQNDGTRIAVLATGQLHLLHSWPADALSEAAALDIEGWPREMFLAADQAVVFSSVWQPRTEPDVDSPPCPLAAAGSIWCGYYGNNATKITLVDVSALDAPRVGAEIFLPGSYLSARRIGDRVRVVLTEELRFPDGVQFWPQGLAPGASRAARDRAFDALEAANEAIIRSKTLDDWLRRGRIARPDGSTVELSYACEDFAVSSGSSRPGILTIATVDLTNQALVSRTSVLAHADVIYASHDTLYTAVHHWWWWDAAGQEDATYLHAFDLRDPDRAPYLGSGEVDGTVDDQYQLDELDGHLRVASLLRIRDADGTPWGWSVRTSSEISVLALEGGRLRTAGKTAPFGEDEFLFGTRFVGTRGFAITSRSYDPLFTFDLSDPASPAKVGEVQMPGFIAYLHPIDDTHLLGVGRERAGGIGPMQVKVQLLDVTDLAKPVAEWPALVGSGWSWSEALWDPKAFTWLGARGALAIPFQDYAPDSFVSDLRLFHVDPASGIDPLGALSMGDVYESTEWDFYWSPVVRRGILADDFAYAVSDAGVRSAKVAELPAWLATVRFARPTAP